MRRRDFGSPYRTTNRRKKNVLEGETKLRRLHRIENISPSPIVLQDSSSGSFWAVGETDIFFSSTASIKVSTRHYKWGR